MIDHFLRDCNKGSLRCNSPRPRTSKLYRKSPCVELGIVVPSCPGGDIKLVYGRKPALATIEVQNIRKDHWWLIETNSLRISPWKSSYVYRRLTGVNILKVAGSSRVPGPSRETITYWPSVGPWIFTLPTLTSWRGPRPKDPHCWR